MASDATNKIIARFFEIVREWRIVVEDDESNPKLAPAWKLIASFPDAMADYGHWVDMFRVAITTDRIVPLAIEVPHTEGHREPFLVLLDLDNARIFIAAMRPQYQVSIAVYNETRHPVTEAELASIFEDAQMEAYRRMGIVLNTLAEQMKIATPPWGELTQMLTQLRPMAFYSEKQASVAFIDFMTMHSSDKAWYDFVWNACRAYRLDEKHDFLLEDGTPGTPADRAETDQELDKLMKSAPPPDKPKAKRKPKPAAKSKPKPKTKPAAKTKPKKKAKARKK